jgi:hypothetical protein
LSIPLISLKSLPWSVTDWWYSGRMGGHTGQSAFWKLRTDAHCTPRAATACVNEPCEPISEPVPVCTGITLLSNSPHLIMAKLGHTVSFSEGPHIYLSQMSFPPTYYPSLALSPAVTVQNVHLKQWYREESWPWHEFYFDQSIWSRPRPRDGEKSLAQIGHLCVTHCCHVLSLVISGTSSSDVHWRSDWPNCRTVRMLPMLESLGSKLSWECPTKNIVSP